MAMAMGLLPRLYRQILRHAGRIDRAAHLKTLLYVHPVLRDSVAGPGSMGDLATGSGADERPSLSQFCKAFMGGEVFYHPLLREEHGLSNMSLRELVRGCFDSRRVRQPGEGGSRGGGGDGSAASTPLDRGFLALRLLSSTVAMGAGSSSPPSSSASAIGGSLAHLRAALEAEGVRCDTIVEHAGGFAARHPQVSLGAGDFLHAHPCLVQGNLTRSVICMADHDDSSGSLGVVINGPSPFVLEDDSPIALAAFSEAVQEAFAGKRIWVGGDVGMGSLYCIYRDGGSVGGDGDSGGVGGMTAAAAAAAAAAKAEPSQAAGARGLPEGEGGRETENAGAGPLSGDRCIGAVPGLYMQADLDLVAELILRGDLHRDDVRLFTGYCGWGPQQLRREVEMGTWHVLGAASDAHVFKALIGDPQLDLPALGGRHRGAGDGGSDGNGGGGHERVRPSHHHHHHDEHTGGGGEGGGGHAALHGSQGGSSDGGDAVDLCGAEWEVMDAAHRAQLSGQAVAFDEHAPEHEQLFNHHHHHSVRRRRRPNADDTAVAAADSCYYDDEEGEADVDALFRAGVVSREEFELIVALTDAHRGSGGRGGGGADGASPPHYNASVDFDDGAVVGGWGGGNSGGGGGGGGDGDDFDDHFDVDDFMGDDDDGDNDSDDEDDDLGTDFLGFMGGMPGTEDDGPGSVFEMTKALWWAASVQDVDNAELRKAVEVFASPSEQFIERMDALYKV